MLFLLKHVRCVEGFQDFLFFQSLDLFSQLQNQNRFVDEERIGFFLQACLKVKFEEDYYFSTARKSGNISHILKAFLSDTRQSMKRRIATERLSKIYIARCGYTWLDESKWPQEWPISPITIIYLKIPSEKMKSFCLLKTGF